MRFELYGKVVLELNSVGAINSAPQFSIKISRTGGERCYCTFKVSPLDVDGKVVNEESDEFVFEKEDGSQTWKFPPITNKSKWIGYKTLLLSEDTLSLKCYFAISWEQ
ncbi:hypothetical protein AVEN_221476-1 [Araneus ventricosus]|uniref:MATH domain-containing protein n=1 Tax=Araneus ventricosus TaxID=182803 RepID=A0A4Y2U5N4_ARAVE|nr:hypothetical protein AVEN_221476-1 [Araneus ventricosus]